ncbi:MAG TPA: hypothetical protein VK694_03455 [Verrucomicrobiae bacterium]|nr:hypothetical protein [Verrucomicrobiae bacterium]
MTAGILIGLSLFWLASGHAMNDVLAAWHQHVAWPLRVLAIIISPAVAVVVLTVALVALGCKALMIAVHGLQALLGLVRGVQASA